MRNTTRVPLNKLALLLMIFPIIGLVQTTRADAAPVGYTEYVALGDSWSADVVLADLEGSPATNHAPAGCFQSERNYPKLLAAALKVRTFKDATCGSATTVDFSQPQSLPTGETNAPQYARLTKNTDLVTVGIGGNDAGFAAAALNCLSVLPFGVPLAFPAVDLPVPLVPSRLPLGGCKEYYTAGGVDQLALAINGSEDKLVTAFKTIRAKSPKARILAVDYLAGIPSKGCYPVVPITDSDMAYLFSTFNKLNAMVKRAASRGGAEFVNTYTPSIGHDVCQSPTTRYVEGLGVLSVNGVAVAVPAHPNSAGAASQFRAVLKAVSAR